MAMDPNKVDFHAWMYPETLKRIEDLYKKDGCKTKAIFVERAVNFYCSYLYSQGTNDCLPELIDRSIKSNIKNLEDKMCNLLFKNSVELSMLLHVFSATHNVSENNLDKLRDTCVKEVKALNGSVSFKNALRYQKDR